MENGSTRVGALFQTVSVSNAIAVIVPPTTNLSGIIIRTCTLNLNATGAISALGTLVADTAAPASIGAGRVIASIGTGANTATSQTVPYEIFVPPGLGLWWAATAAAAGTQNSVTLTYDILSPS